MYKRDQILLFFLISYENSYFQFHKISEITLKYIEFIEPDP